MSIFIDKIKNQWIFIIKLVYLSDYFEQIESHLKAAWGLSWLSADVQMLSLVAPNPYDTSHDESIIR